MWSCTFLVALMLCTRWGFIKLVEQTIQLHVNCSYYKQCVMFSMILYVFMLVAFIFIAGAISKTTTVFLAMQK